MKHLLYEREGDLAIVRVNRSETLNALNTAVLNELDQCLQEQIQQQIKVFILTGVGDKAFIAGADIKEMHEMDHLQMLKFCELGQLVADRLENSPFVTIAAINGYALGGGLEMALACDMICASQTAKLGLPEVTLGLIPGFGGTQRLARCVGNRLAKEWIMSAKVITAEEGQKAGIVNRIFDNSALIEETKKLAQQILKHSFPSLLRVKQAINEGQDLPLSSALILEKVLCGICFDTREREELMKAFLDKKAKK